MVLYAVNIFLLSGVLADSNSKTLERTVISTYGSFIAERLE